MWNKTRTKSIVQVKYQKANMFGLLLWLVAVVVVVVVGGTLVVFFERLFSTNLIWRE